LVISLSFFRWTQDRSSNIVPIASKLLGRGPEPTLSFGNIQADPENLSHLPVIVQNTLVGPEYRDPLAAAPHIFIHTEGVAIRVAHETCQICRQISAFEAGRRCECTQHRLV